VAGIVKNFAEGGPVVRLARTRLDQAPASLRSQVAVQEERFGVRFETVTEFPRKVLDWLHQPAAPEPAAVPSPLGSDACSEPCVAEAMATLTRVANLSRKDVESRAEYLQALYALFLTLEFDVREHAADPLTVCVGPEREGRQIGEALGFLPPDRSLTPNAKRVPHADGLLVALTECVPRFDVARCLIVDGVLATGATVITTIDHLRDHADSFVVVCAHSTPAGVRALNRYADAVGIDLELHVAVTSGTLNARYYAIDESDPSLLVLGDVGDTISGVALVSAQDPE
jgi:hypothetical protein